MSTATSFQQLSHSFQEKIKQLQEYVVLHAADISDPVAQSELRRLDMEVTNLEIQLDQIRSELKSVCLTTYFICCYDRYAACMYVLIYLCRYEFT
jgi:hypothetical protein